ncbi:CIA30 family protein [uncultured Croceitalea sp.]|uniref:CIA30 family protein n=1 Tax=uncultured Croceitalea sp. TaxID=1798908 RepID=UPI00374FCA13
MKLILILFFLTSIMSSQTIVNFKENPTTKNWSVIDDVVMGGRSTGRFELTNDDCGKFYGEVSIENNGGFSSVKYDMETIKVAPKNKIRIRLKGDGKTYQFRVKANKKEYYNYITEFKTTGEWQILELLLADLYPTFRGRKLNLPDFNKNTIEELRFLIGNKKEQKFELILESIEMLKTN